MDETSPETEESSRKEYDHPPYLKKFCTKLKSSLLDPRFVIEILALIGLVFYVCETRRTNNLTEAALANSKDQFIKSQSLSKEQFANDERPYIWATNNGLGAPEYFLPSNAANIEPRKIGQIVWTYHYTDYGKTPAYNVVTTSRRIRLGKTSKFGTSYGFGKKIPGTPVPPGKDDFASAVSDPGISQEQFNRLSRTDEGITIQIVIEYSDSSGKNKYETGMCFTKLALGPIQYCEDGNYIK